MALRENNRKVYIGKLQAEVKYRNKKGNGEISIPFSNLNLSLEKTLSLWKKDYIEDWLNSNAKYLYPREVRIEEKNGIAIILFDAIDPHGADVTYKNYKTLESRRNKKEQYEGINYSAHLVIKTDGNNGAYNAVFEDVPYLAIGTINHILSKMVRIICKHNKELFTIPSPTGVPDEHGKIKRVTCRLQLSFSPVPDQRFWDLVSRPKAVLDLELVNTKLRNDEDISLDIKRQSIVFALPSPSFFATAKDSLLRIVSFGQKRSYDLLKMTIKTDAGNSKTICFKTDTKSLNYDAFSRMELIEGLQEKMATAPDRINEELVERMKELLS